MDANKGNIFQILNGNRQFIIPVYQRVYSWNIEQCERLWNDIVKMQKNGKSFHFIGSIVNITQQAMPTGIQKFVIIDGQQRMITLALMMIALRNYSINNSDNNAINPRLIDNMLLKNECESNDNRYKILPSKNDRQIFQDLVNNAQINPNTKSKLIDNYNFFVGKISKNELDPEKIYEAIGKLQIVNITLDREDDDAQAIFESLNSTGLDLSQSDLIRNYILMGLEPDKQTSLYENVWMPLENLFASAPQWQWWYFNEFFRFYLTMKRSRVLKGNQVYDEFKSYREDYSSVKLEDLCKDIYIHAQFYVDIVFCKSTIEKFADKKKELVKLYNAVKLLDMTVSYPFFLKVHKDCYDEKISVDELIEIIRICINYVLRRRICGFPTNSHNSTFAALCNRINNDDYVNSIKAFFVLSDGSKEFPNDEKFAEAFKTRDIYNMRTRNFILSSLENFDNHAPINIENYTIEHIMPQNPKLNDEWRKELGDKWQEIQKQYLHTIGNLTLTAYNSSMSDKSFTEKMNMKGGFKESALRLNSSLVKLTEWNEKQIKARAEEMAKKALKIWEYPKISDEELKRLQPDNDSEVYTLESYNADENELELFDILDKRIKNLSPDVKREFKKLYVAYKLDKNFVCVQFLNNKLSVIACIDFNDVFDPKGICSDVRRLESSKNGTKICMENISEIDDVMNIVEQSFKLQLDE